MVYSFKNTILEDGNTKNWKLFHQGHFFYIKVKKIYNCTFLNKSWFISLVFLLNLWLRLLRSKIMINRKTIKNKTTKQIVNQINKRFLCYFLKSYKRDWMSVLSIIDHAYSWISFSFTGKLFFIFYEITSKSKGLAANSVSSKSLTRSIDLATSS